MLFGKGRIWWLKRVRRIAQTKGMLCGKNMVVEANETHWTVVFGFDVTVSQTRAVSE